MPVADAQHQHQNDWNQVGPVERHQISDAPLCERQACRLGLNYSKSTLDRVQRPCKGSTLSKLGPVKAPLNACVIMSGSLGPCDHSLKSAAAKSSSVTRQLPEQLWRSPCMRGDHMAEHQGSCQHNAAQRVAHEQACRRRLVHVCPDAREQPPQQVSHVEQQEQQWREQVPCSLQQSPVSTSAAETAHVASMQGCQPADVPNISGAPALRRAAGSSPPYSEEHINCLLRHSAALKSICTNVTCQSGETPVRSGAGQLGDTGHLRGARRVYVADRAASWQDCAPSRWTP